MPDRGIVFYRGPSVLDPATNIVGVATLQSDNRKTGNMIQTWILRTDRSPVEAILDGTDAAICGDCRHRGVPKSKAEPRTCYVNVGKAPLAVYRAFKAGSYRPGTIAEVASLGRPVRLGAYGDPVAVPWPAWAGIQLAPKWTGYTHQWRRLEAAPFKGVLMASCDSVREALDAVALGWRTFLVRAVDTRVPDGMIPCPATTGRTQCGSCGLCNGNESWKAPNVTIEAHGSAAAFVG